jgi:hypothetical protein
LAAALPASNRSQSNTVTQIRYSKRNSTARDHVMGTRSQRNPRPLHLCWVLARYRFGPPVHFSALTSIVPCVIHSASGWPPPRLGESSRAN